MSQWRSQHYKKAGDQQKIDSVILENAIAIGDRITAINAAVTPIFTLGHLAQLTGVDYKFLRAIVSHSIDEPYKIFKIRKRSGPNKEVKYRRICVPDPTLMSVQKWIVQNILCHVKAHSASYAYQKGNKIKDAASLHLGCQWLIKLDIQNFFESISEIAVYRVFHELGYPPLVAFELARLCTRLGGHTKIREHSRWYANSFYGAIETYNNGRIGHLPQGAPTSPMLSNLAMRVFDKEVEKIAVKFGLCYSRYADDLCFSTANKKFTRREAVQVIEKIYKKMGCIGLLPNQSKMHISPPGSRKIILGILVDGNKLSLPRDFRAKLRQHIHYLRHPEFGPVRHAAEREFESVVGLRHYIYGLINYAKDIDPSYANDCIEKLREVRWPI